MGRPSSSEGVACHCIFFFEPRCDRSPTVFKVLCGISCEFICAATFCFTLIHRQSRVLNFYSVRRPCGGCLFCLTNICRMSGTRSFLECSSDGMLKSCGGFD